MAFGGHVTSFFEEFLQHSIDKKVHRLFLLFGNKVKVNGLLASNDDDTDADLIHLQEIADCPFSAPSVGRMISNFYLI